MGLLLSGVLMFSSVEREEEAVSCDTLGLRLHAFSDLDSKSVPHKHACAHMQAHTRSEASAEGDSQSVGSAQCAVDLDNSC